MQNTIIELSLPIEGMTCASCVNRVERFLRKTDGVVDANVNLATEQATVRFDPILVGRAELEKAVEDAGYEVRPDTDASSAHALALTDATDAQVQRQRAEQRGLGVEALIALSIGVAMMVLTLWPSPLLPLEARAAAPQGAPRARPAAARCAPAGSRAPRVPRCAFWGRWCTNQGWWLR